MLTNLFDLLYPNPCIVCGRHLTRFEKYFCVLCEAAIPQTHFARHKSNPMRRSLKSRAGIFHASAFLYFNKGNSVQNLLHLLKYRGEREVGTTVGRMFGKELQNIPELSCVSHLIPVPLHPAKHLQRGYNQSTEIARGIAEYIPGILNETLLLRTQNSVTQTGKNRQQRWSNVSEVFKINPLKSVEGSHLLLVDDVFTTGATLEACAQMLRKLNPGAISAVTLAYTDY